jgi:hypothetical protein
MNIRGYDAWKLASPDEDETPADLLRREREEHAEEIKRLTTALDLVVDYLSQRSDVVDGDYGQPAPNEEMQLLTEIEEALGKGGY